MKQRATYLCGPDPTLRDKPCPSGGEPHSPFVDGYGASEEYAAQLLRTGWMQHRCPACGLWALWRPRGYRAASGPAPEMPPMEVRDTPYVLRDGAGCRPCNDGRPCPAVSTR